MKKIMAGILAAAMMLGMGMTALAANYDENGEEITYPEDTYTDVVTVTVSKTYHAVNADTVSPAETFTFTELTCTDVTYASAGVTAENAPVPVIGSVDYAAGDAGDADEMTKEVTIELPAYESVGVYTYLFSETEGDTAGVTYYGQQIKLVVTVIEQNGRVRVAAVHMQKEDGNEEKIDDFENSYAAGSLTVTKAVTGLFGDKLKDDFLVTVTFTAPEGKVVREAIRYTDDGEERTISADDLADGSESVEITLGDTESVTFTNIPYGVTYTVAEADYTADGYDEADYDYDDANVISGEGASAEFTVNAESHSMTITNNKDGVVNTGVSVDSIPYIVLLSAAVLCAGAAFTKKRVSADR